jgi:hypothetical protein
MLGLPNARRRSVRALSVTHYSNESETMDECVENMYVEHVWTEYHVAEPIDGLNGYSTR